MRTVVATIVVALALAGCESMKGCDWSVGAAGPRAHCDKDNPPPPAPAPAKQPEPPAKN